MKLKNNLLLVLAALIWGVAFVAQSVGMEYVGPFTFNSVRFIIGGLVLIPCIILFDRRERKESGKKMSADRKRPEDKKTLLIGGLCCGIFLTVASTLQQFGIMHTTVGKAGFITALYMIIVPVAGIFLGKKIALPVWVSVGLGVAGMYLLCITESFSINFGDVLVLLCAVGFTGHILVIDYFSPRVDGVKMSCIQFFICGIVCAVPALLREHPNLTVIVNAWQPILYTGVLSCGVAYTLQIVAQKGTNPVAESGIGFFRAGRMADPGAAYVGEGDIGLCVGICRDCFGADSVESGKKRNRRAGLIAAGVFFVPEWKIIENKRPIRNTAL